MSLSTYIQHAQSLLSASDDVLADVEIKDLITALYGRLLCILSTSLHPVPDSGSFGRSNYQLTYLRTSQIKTTEENSALTHGRDTEQTSSSTIGDARGEIQYIESNSDTIARSLGTLERDILHTFASFKSDILLHIIELERKNAAYSRYALKEAYQRYLSWRKATHYVSKQQYLKKFRIPDKRSMVYALRCGETFALLEDGLTGLGMIVRKRFLLKKQETARAFVALAKANSNIVCLANGIYRGWNLFCDLLKATYQSHGFITFDAGQPTIPTNLGSMAHPDHLDGATGGDAMLTMPDGGNSHIGNTNGLDRVNGGFDMDTLLPNDSLGAGTFSMSGGFDMDTLFSATNNLAVTANVTPEHTPMYNVGDPLVHNIQHTRNIANVRIVGETSGFDNVIGMFTGEVNREMATGRNAMMLDTVLAY